MGSASGKSSGQSITALSGLQIQASSYGVPIPIVWGVNRITGNLLWYANFSATPQYSGGGKGGGGSTPTSYAYSASCIIGLCEGGAYTAQYRLGGGWSAGVWIDTIWSSKNCTNAAALNLTFSVGGSDLAFSQPTWPWLVTNFPTQALNYANTATVYSSSMALSSSAQAPNLSYEIIGMMNIGEVSAQARTITAISGTTITSVAHGFTQNQSIVLHSTGTAPQCQFGSAVNVYLFVCNITDADHFSVAGFAQQPNSSTNEPIYSFTSAGTGIITAVPFLRGANPADIVKDFLTNTRYGVNAGNQLLNGSLTAFSFPVAPLDDTTFTSGAPFSQYCIANGIFLSPALTSQIAASNFITTICEICNSESVWSQGNLKIVPYGDSAVTSNGATYTPNTTPQYNLGDDDFLSDGTSDPIVVIRSNPADAFNQIQVNFSDQTAQYNTGVAQAQDQANIDLYGLRAQHPYSYNYITDATVARKVAQIKLQRLLYIRNQYTFKLGWKYARLEPMDLVTITDSALGYSNHVVRIIEVEEDTDEQLSIIAEDYLVSNATATAHPTQPNNGYQTLFNRDPGNALAPIILPAPAQLATSIGVPELWLATAGGSNWGGCDVYVSLDNITYSLQGTQKVPARMGIVATNQLPTHSDPDTANTLTVDLSASGATLTSGTRDDADSLRSLCVVNLSPNLSMNGAGQELIAYGTATLVSANVYTLSYLRRGAYGSKTALPHLVGAPFARLDYLSDGILRIQVNPNLIGKTIYIKLVSFNKYGAYGGSQSLSAVPYYSYLVPSTFAPAMVNNVTGLELFGLGNSTTFTGRDAKFSWRTSSASAQINIGSEFYGAGSGAQDVWFKDYEVRILVGGAIARIEHTTDNFYTYTYEKNLADTGGPATSFCIQVFERGVYNQLSQIGASLSVSHGYPVTPTLSLQAVVGGFIFTIINQQPDQASFTNIAIWATPDPSTTPSSIQTIYTGSANTTSSMITVPYAGTGYYVQCKAVDAYGNSSVVSNIYYTQTINTAANQGYFGSQDGGAVSTFITNSAIGTGGSFFAGYCPTTQLVYVMDGTYVLYALNPNTLETVATIPTTGMFSGGCTPCWCPTAKLFYMTQQGSNTITTFNPSTNVFIRLSVSLRATTSIDGLRNICYNPANGYIYFATGDVLNPLSNTIVVSLNPFNSSSYGTSLCYCPTNQSVYLNEVYGNTFVISSATTPTVTATVAATAPWGQRNNITFCSANAMLYVTEINAAHTYFTLVKPLNPVTNTFWTNLVMPITPQRVGDVIFCPNTGKIAVLIIGYVDGMTWNAYVAIFDPVGGNMISCSAPVEDYGGSAHGAFGFGNTTHIEYLGINQKLLLSNTRKAGLGFCSYLFST